MRKILIDISFKPFSFGLALDKEETHIFAIPTENHFSTAKKTAEDILSDREQDKAMRFINQKDKERYLVSKYCLRKLLAYFLDTSAAEVDFFTKDEQKPATKGIEFNISHTGNYVVIGISRKLIGVDVEFLNREFDFDSILETGFSAREVEFIGKTSVDVTNFYTLWTRKEALLKAVGEGLSDNLHEIDCLNDVLERNKLEFKAYSLLLANDYIISLATQTPAQHINYWLWS